MSSETLRASLKKIKSAPNNWRLYAGIAFIVAYGVIALGPYLLKASTPGYDKLLLDSKIYNLQVVKTEAEQEKGLSGRTSMPANEGMLFDFGSNGNRCMWMKDMRFGLDIIWADTDKKVTAVERNLLPSTYPTTFCSTARYVVELNEGATTVSTRRMFTVSVGDHLHFR